MGFIVFYEKHTGKMVRMKINEVSNNLNYFPYVVVGSGFYGLTVAEQLTSQLDVPVVVIEKRNHIGGNAYSSFDKETGIEIHHYGSHLFHTSNEMVWEYVKRFTTFNDYVHRVKTTSSNQVYSMPINLHTINQFLGRALSPNEAMDWLNSVTKKGLKENHAPPGGGSSSESHNFETKAISLIGQPLYEAFIKGYTEKQWQTDPRLLPEEIITRLPVRLNYNDRYFSDTYEGLPSAGYLSWMQEMTKNPKIKVITDLDFFNIKHILSPSQKVIYTGPIDRYFNYSEGVLGWRTLDFHKTLLDIPDFQGTSVMNYADAQVPFTRIHEFKHLHPEREYLGSKTIIMHEYSRTASTKDEPYYPINSSEDRKMLERYRALAAMEQSTYFGGRLGRYQYLDMHMAIGSALQLAKELIAEFRARGAE
jgi:UDP-galactopyranose mutase